MIIESLALVIFVIFSIALPEYIKSIIAEKLGDPTNFKKNTIDKEILQYIDLLGTIILPIIIILITSGSMVLGYPKAARINSYHFKNPKKDMLVVTLSGPLTNLAIIFIFLLLFHLGVKSAVLTQLIAYNFILFMVNLIPLPGLPGVYIMSYFLSPKSFYQYLKVKIIGLTCLISLAVLGFFRGLSMFIFNILLPILGIRSI